MKKPSKTIALAALSSVCLFLAPQTRGAVTGQWDFKKGDLSATIGQNLVDYNANDGLQTLFGTTASFGISSIGGTPTNVMKFPASTDQYGGYLAPVGASANGGGQFVNQYSLIMDVLFPSTDTGKTEALFVTDVGGEVTATVNGPLSFGGASGGVLTPDVWHRVAATVDTANNVSLYIDGNQVAQGATPGGLDGTFSISSYVFLFDDASTNSQPGYTASIQFQDVTMPAGLISALGSPVATGILTGPPPNPYVVSESPTSDLRFPTRSAVVANPKIQIVIADGAATVNPATIALTFNGAAVTPVVNRSAPTTTISYQVPAFLAPLSSNSVSLSFQDSASDNLGVKYSFFVGPYIALPAAIAGPVGSANTPGFIYRVAQAPADATIPNSLGRAQSQLDGTLLDTNGIAYTNEAVLNGPGSQADGSYFIDQYEGTSGTIAFDYQGSAFYQLPSFTTYQFPGIPGVNGSTTNFADDTLTYLQLDAGSYVFGVVVGIARVDAPPGADDGYALFCGANPRDEFSTLVGQFVRTGGNFNDTQNTNQFLFVAPVAGVYPFRLVHWQNNGPADLGWYYIDPVSGNKVLINDPSGPISAFRVSTIAREPYVAEVFPAPGGAGFPANAPISVVLSDDDLQVASGSIKLFLNGTQVPLNSTTKAGKLTTVVYNPNANRTAVTNVMTVIYSDNASTPKSFTNSWAFTIVAGGSGVPEVTGQWDFDNGNLTATVGRDLAYYDGASGTTAGATAFGTCSSFGIPKINGTDAKVMKVPGNVAGSGNNGPNFGYVMDHQIAPNGGGTKVNQYTIIWDMYYSGGVLPFFQCQSPNNAGIDGSLFLQNGDMGQGGGGYTMNHGAIATGWHRIAFSVDLSQNLITKWVDGVKAQDWISSANALDAARRAWQPSVLLFADGDGDDFSSTVYVDSIQVRNGRLTDTEMVALGGPSGTGIPGPIPASSVTGQWDFQFGDLSATVGQDLQYYDGPTGTTAGATAFGTCSSFGIPLLNSTDAKVMMVPGNVAGSGNNGPNFGYVMDHQIAPNGGGTKVNQYTIIWDMYYSGGVLPFFQCQSSNNAGIDGSLFLQNGDMGQGGGGYTMNHGAIATGWHRIAFAVDLSQNLITKWVDGVKAQDWVSSANALDAARRAWQPSVLLFADGDGDDFSSTVYVRSIQVSAGKLSDAAMAALGGPDGNNLPVAPPATSVTGQWDFNFGDLSATVGKDLQYYDGAAGVTFGATVFGSCSSLGIPLINGIDALVMEVPGNVAGSGNNGVNFGYVMDHSILPNGGGTKVNQYTIIWDMYYSGGVLPFFQCQSSNNAGIDGSLFLQNGDMGQGGGGYTMNNGPIATGWHRIAFAADLSQNLITKWVDGVKAQDWVSSANALDAARRAWQPSVLLFADGDGDDFSSTVYVDSIQVSAGKMSDAAMEALGGPSGTGIPIAAPVIGPIIPPTLKIARNGDGTLTLSWALTAIGWTLQSSPALGHAAVWTPSSAPVVNNSVTLTITPGTQYFRLVQ